MRGPELTDLQSLTNLLRNGGFEEWGTSAPVYWTLAGTGATVTEDAAVSYVGSRSAVLTRAAADATLTQDATDQALPLAYAQGKTFTLSARVRPSAAGIAIIGLDDGVKQVWTGYPTHTDVFTSLSVTLTVSNAATKLEAVCKVKDAAGSARFDACMLTEGWSIPNFSPNPADSKDPQNSDTTAPTTPTGLSATTKVLSVLLQWTANPESDLDYYEVQRATDAGFTANVTAWKVYATQAQDKTDTTTTYHYRVRAVRWSKAVSAWSSGVSAAGSLVGTPEIGASAVSGILQTVDLTSIEVSGDAGVTVSRDVASQSFDATGGEVLVSTEIRVADSGAVSGDATSYTVKLKRGSTVLWQRDGNIAGESGAWDTQGFTYLDDPGAGTFTYAVELEGVNPTLAWSLTASNRLIQNMELKR